VREVTLEVPMEIPNSRTATINLGLWLTSIRSQIGAWGMDGRSVGIGFEWRTRTAISNNRLQRITGRIKRALWSSLVVSRDCEPYNLEQRIVYVRTGEAKGILKLKEG